MKKLSFFLFFIFALFGSILFAFASNIFEIRSISYDKLSFEIYSNIHSSNGDPFFSMTEINKKVDKIPRAMKPYLKMIINHAPRPKNGLKLKVFSKNYTIYFKDEKDWKYFKNTVIKIISKTPNHKDKITL